MWRSQGPQPMHRNMRFAQDFRCKGASPLQPLAALLLVCPFAAALLGCGGGGSSKSNGTSGSPSISVAVSPATSTVLEGKTQVFTAALTNDSGAKGVNWTATCSVSSCGTLSGATTTSVTYTAPGPVASNLTLTVTATSVADATKSGTATISVPAIAVAVVPTSASVNGGGSTTITPTVTNDPASAPGVTWTVSCSTASCGSVSPTSTASGTATTYTAPTALTSNLAVTVKATSATDTTKSATATITVRAALTVSIAPNTASVVVSTTQNFTATVTNDPGNGGVTWALSGAGCTGAACGTLSATSSASGTPVAYTAPAAVPAPATVTLTATSVTDTTKTATATITVTVAPACGTGGSEALLNGQYAFLLKGFDSGTGAGETSPQPVLVGGVISADGAGHITAGAMDMNLNSGVQTNLSVTSGSYGVTSDQRGCMVITTSAGTQDYRFSLGNISSGVASTVHVIGFDSTGPFTAGIMRKQTTSAFSTSQVTGNYAFGVSSAQNTAQTSNGVAGGKFAAVGVFNFSTGSVTGGEVDFNNNGQLDANSLNTTWPASPISFLSGGIYTVSSTNGRGTLSFTLNVSGAPVVNTIIYVVSSVEVLVLNSDPQASNSAFAGELLQQSGTPFSANPLSGSYVGYASGLGSTSGSRTDLTLLGPMTSGSNVLSFTQLRNDGGAFSSRTVNGTYSVSSTGRVTIAITGNVPMFYLVSPTQAFFLAPNGGVNSGFFESQSSGPFDNSSASGTYAFGTINPEVAAAADTSGVAMVTPATATVNTTQDHDSNGSQTLGGTQSQTYSVDTTGLVYIPTGCTFSTTSTTCQVLSYIISPTKLVIMNTTNPTPNTQVLDQ